MYVENLRPSSLKLSSFSPYPQLSEPPSHFLSVEMRFSTGFSVLACGAVALAATISPDVFATRATSDVVANVNTLDTTLDATFAKLG